MGEPTPEEVLREAVTLAFHGTAMWARDKRHAALAALDQLLQERDDYKLAAGAEAQLVDVAQARIRELEAERDELRATARENKWYAERRDEEISREHSSIHADLRALNDMLGLRYDGASSPAGWLHGDIVPAVARLGAELAEARSIIERLLADGCETGMAYCEDSGCFWCGELRPLLQKDIPHRADCAYVAALAAHPVEEPAPKPAMPDPEGRWTSIQALARKRGLCGELVYGEEGAAVCLLQPGHSPAHPVEEGPTK